MCFTVFRPQRGIEKEGEREKCQNQIKDAFIVL